jgi:beta-N-acetylhexosaminidase
MTLEHKVAQMFLVTLHGSVMTEVGADFLQTWQPGGVVLFGQNTGTPDATTRLTNDFQSTILAAGGPPLLIAIDQEGGVVSRLTAENGYTFFPAPVLVGAAGDDIAYRIGSAIGTELSAVGINMNLAPVADLETNPDNPIIFRRSFGSDPEIAGEAVAQVAMGIQAQNVLATAKHFPGHGESAQDSHAVLQGIDLPRERLDSVEIAAFRPAIDNNIAAIMVAHLWFPAIDPTRRPASLSPEVVTGVLRNDLGFEGLIVTDAMDMNAVDMEVEYTESMVAAVEAGVDLMALGPSFGLPLAELSMQAVVDAVRGGRISEERINESARRILAAKQRFGLYDWQPLDPFSATQRVDAETHAALITELYQTGLTVAYDRNNLIPITPDKKVAFMFLATRYQIYNDCNAYGHPNIEWLGVGDSPDGGQITQAARMAEAADVAVVFTQNAIDNPQQQALVNALPPEKTIAVAIWSHYDWTTYPNVAAYMMTYTPSAVGGPAIPAACAVLFGAYQATGTLPVTLGENLPAGSSAN